MGSRDPRVDAYIEKSAEFARPILRHLREVVHAACPETEEAIKWGMPHFLYQGGLLCGFAAFKKHCSFGFWKGAQVVADAADESAMGQFGCLTELSQLPSKKVLTAYIHKAMKIKRDGAAPAAAKKAAKPKPAPLPPADFLAAMGKKRKALACFEAFSPSHKREYIEWITEAKRDETRQRRIAQAVEWLAEGKPRNWKYMDC
ncbi:YdeI/OmpD-associated family protein [Arenimonas oryziterrae]|uniref:YdhG-like domain-containing protein n=1 Tax=Arenimonas oryziterrae DSM 21050 = YC6267 TaxID=1121015 RepID=A0A091AU05_9GAMM|nr:YdeI/OmpD-associated family protein [Arenimonas oryziterrae]KFN42826.1 hypothetical protein N789_11895 [Arenimonas oryziterrae DSM 21050 = YC6267]